MFVNNCVCLHFILLNELFFLEDETELEEQVDSAQTGELPEENKVIGSNQFKLVYIGLNWLKM